MAIVYKRLSAKYCRDSKFRMQPKASTLVLIKKYFMHLFTASKSTINKDISNKNVNHLMIFLLL